MTLLRKTKIIEFIVIFSLQVSILVQLAESLLFNICVHTRCVYTNHSDSLHSGGGGGEKLWQSHLPLERLLAKNGHKQRGECEQPLHRDRQRELGRIQHRLLWPSAQTTTLLKLMEVCQQLVPFTHTPENT